MAVFEDTATAFGYGLFAYTAAQFATFLYFNLRPSSLPIYGKKHRLYNVNSRTWALVTGASDGLGVAWANTLASSGFNVIIHGRNQAKLDSLKLEIEVNHQVQVRTLVIDAEHQPIAFDEVSYAVFEKAVNDAISDIPLTILINNIGIIGTWKPMVDCTPAIIDGSININVRFATLLTRQLLPTLSRNSPGLIINVTSEADASPVAYAAMYTGAKAWGQAFHRSLKYEMGYEGQNIEVLSLVYGFIATGSTGRTNEDREFGVATPEEATRAALNQVGSGYSIVTPVLGHQLQGWVVRLFPTTVRERLVAKIMRVQKDRMEGIAKKD